VLGILSGLLVLVVVLLLVARSWSSTSAFRSQGILLPLKSPSTPATLPQTCVQAASAPNPIVAENSCPGTTTWRLDHLVVSPNNISAFPVPATVDQGQPIQFYVRTTAPTYTFSIYRIGWYQGTGGRLMYTSPVMRGIQQPNPTTDSVTHMVSCTNWHDPATVQIPPTWVSGVYIVKFVSSQSEKSYAIFVVRDDASRASILMSISLMTYQAYNEWGEYSLYFGPQAGLGNSDRAYAVSFDRPYDAYSGLGNFPVSAYSLVRWSEHEGFDMSYSSDVDTDLRGSTLVNHRLVIFADHDEYWSTQMRQNSTTARDHGTSLAFFAANNVYWHIRLSASPFGPDRIITCYKSANIDPMAASEPLQATVEWRNLAGGEPENALTGAMYQAIVRGIYPLVLSEGAALLLQGTGLHPGSQLPGLVGGEFDNIWHNGSEPQNMTVLASSFVHCDLAACPPDGIGVSQAVVYTAPSGARVFDAGTFYWSWGLDDAIGAPYVSPRNYANASFQRFTYNLIQYLLGGNANP
jgi:hypothetical protein